MPIAITPRRRPRSEIDFDDDASASPDEIPSSQPELNSPQNKRARLPDGHASPSSNRKDLANGYHSQSEILQKERMQASGSPKTHQPGSIVRVKLANFVTYSAAEFFPGPSLNMVIGPNGTGKSTLVCAICLGLGWGPQHLGRAKEISEYVKHGCQEATIEIELAKDGRKYKNNIIIRCTIKREGNKTAFSINGKPQSKKNVVELCRWLSIQIDNLCQFLPQDKVVEFAAMTPVELLRSTQRAVASQEMIDMHEGLKDLRRKQKDVQARLTSDQEVLTNLEGRQRLQEADVERMRIREQVEKRVTRLEAARPFAAYRSARKKHADAKDKRKIMQDQLKKLQDEVEPALRAVNSKRHYKERIGAVVGDRKATVAKAERHVDGMDRKFRDLQDTANELVATHQAEKVGAGNHRKEILRLEQLIGTVKRQMAEPPVELDAKSYNERIRGKSRKIEDFKTKINELKEKQTELTRRGRERNQQIGQARQDLGRFDSQAGKQTIKLQNVSRETARLWEWVQKNQDQFEKPVFGPPMVECSVKDPKYVDMIETLIQKSSMLTFTVQTNNDMAKLSDQGASMGFSAVYISTMSAGLEKFRPPIGEAEMRRYGFDGWALDFMNGPETVLAMLCYDANLHATGVALRDTTTEQFDLLQDSQIISWLTNKSSYRITRRREYGPGATSTQVKNVRRGMVWTEQPVDLTAKRELQEAIDGWNEEVASFEAEVDQVQAKVNAYRRDIETAQDEAKELSKEKSDKQKAIGAFNVLPTKLAQHEEKIATHQEGISGIRARLKEITDKQDAAAIKRANLALDYADAVEALRISHNDLYEAEVMLIEAQSDLENLDERNTAVKERLQDQERQLGDSVREVETCRQEAYSLIGKCRDLLNDNSDPELREFLTGLSEDQTAEQLESEIDSEKARLALMHEGDGGVIKEYEARKKKMDALIARLEEMKSALTELGDKIAELRGNWEPALDLLVGKISGSFAYNMEQINCAGEVGVHKDDDFDQWAILIRVKFRENEPLTTLDSHRQSGGERAVSTIFYLMSLQSLTRSPFRVVDEINQGMDPRNERLVHKRMVGIACGSNDNIDSSSRTREVAEIDGDTLASRGESQYFLITPKLLHNLTYERGMRVLCIASGEYMPDKDSRINFKECVDLMRGLKA